MQFLSKLCLGVLATVVVLVVGVLLYLSFGDLSVYKEDIERAASNALGHDVAIDGDFDLNVGRRIELVASDVSIINRAWPGDATVVTLARLNAVVDTWSLLRGPVEIDALELETVAVNLEQNGSGDANWQAPVATVGTESEAGPATVILHTLAIEDVALTSTTDGRDNGRLRIAELQLERAMGGVMRVSTRGQAAAGVASFPFVVEGNVREDAGRITVEGMTIDVNDGSLGVDGWFQSRAENLQGEANLILEGSDLSALLQSFAVSDAPPLPYALSTQLVAVPNGVELHDVVAKIGDSLVNGSLSADFSEETPKLIASLNSPSLNIQATEDAQADPGASSGGDSELESARVFSDAPLQYSWLADFDLEAEAFIGKLGLNGDEWTDVNAKAVLTDGLLTIEPFGFNSGDGEMTASLKLTPGDEQYEIQLQLQTKDLRLGALSLQEQAFESIPPLDLDLELSGTGNSIRSLMASANGRLSARQRRGEINLQAAGFLFSDLVVSVLRTLNPLAERDPVTVLECGVYDVSVVDGIASIDNLALQTERLTIVSSGRVDLDTEQIDMALRTKTREGLGVSLGGVVNSFLKVGGTLKEPSIEVDATGSVTTTGAALATGGLSLLAKGLWDRVSAEVELCEQPEDGQPVAGE